MTYDNLSISDHHGKSPIDDKPTPVGDWQQIGTIADRLVTAWSDVEAREEAGNLAAWTTDRQRSMIFQEMWIRATDEWRLWALDWVMTPTAKKGVVRHRQAAEAAE